MDFQSEMKEIKNSDIKLRLELFNIKNKLNNKFLVSDDYENILKSYFLILKYLNNFMQNIDFIYDKCNYISYDDNQKRMEN